MKDRETGGIWPPVFFCVSDLNNTMETPPSDPCNCTRHLHCPRCHGIDVIEVVIRGEPNHWTCVDCGKDFAAAVETLPPDALREMLTDFVQRERALRDAAGKGGQHVGRSPSINPSTLQNLEWMLRNSAALAHQSIVVDLPDNPVAAPCALSGCRYGELSAALAAVPPPCSCSTPSEEGTSQVDAVCPQHGEGTAYDAEKRAYWFREVNKAALAAVPPPLSELVTCSLRDPNQVVHLPRLDCQHEAPHLISACGAFTAPPEPEKKTPQQVEAALAAVPPPANRLQERLEEQAEKLVSADRPGHWLGVQSIRTIELLLREAAAALVAVEPAE